MMKSWNYTAKSQVSGKYRMGKCPNLDECTSTADIILPHLRADAIPKITSVHSAISIEFIRKSNEIHRSTQFSYLTQLKRPKDYMTILSGVGSAHESKTQKCVQFRNCVTTYVTMNSHTKWQINPFTISFFYQPTTDQPTKIRTTLTSSTIEALSNVLS